MAHASSIRRTLQDTFGFERLRPGQREVIDAVLQGEDVLAIMATGAGKSLCYQLPALHLPGLTVIVSPLISLMKDQADKLQEFGLAARALNSSLSNGEQQVVIDQLEEGELEFLFTTPERLASEDFHRILSGLNIDFVVIDEAHCISHWGHDFRPAYLALGQVIAGLGAPPVLALTATATEDVINDIREQLGRPDMRVMNTSVYRPNLKLQVRHVTREQEKLDELLGEVRRSEGSVIIYAATIRSVERIHSFLLQQDVPCLSYHGKLAAKLRSEQQDLFMSGSVKTMVATNAFGMGIDKADIRHVLHFEFPGSLEAYYQEAGRSGRDGETASCTLLYDLNDRRVQLVFLGGKYPSAHQVRIVHQALVDTADCQAVALPVLKKKVVSVPVSKLDVILAAMRGQGLLQTVDQGLQRVIVDDEQTRIEIIISQFEAAAAGDRQGLERMMHYAQSTGCRWNNLLEFFQEETGMEACGSCDNCLDSPA